MSAMSGVSSWFSSSSTSTSTTTATGTNPAEQGKKLGFFAKISDTFQGIAFSMGFGASARHIKDAFKKVDNDRSNHLDTTEFGIIGASFAQGTAAFGAADANANTQVSLGELKTFVRAAALADFRRADVDGNNALSEAESFNAHPLAGVGSSFSFGSADRNNDKLLSFNEFLAERAHSMI